MYTYESFETLGAFTLLRPVFITLLLISLMLFLFVLVPGFKNKLINGFTVISISTVSVVVSGQLLIGIGIIADEINLGGDPVSTILFLAIAGFGLINPFIYFLTQKKEKNNTFKQTIIDN